MLRDLDRKTKSQAKMNITQNQELIDKIKNLAKYKATGTPKQLADSLGISERNLYRIIDCIRDSGTTIAYSRTLRTYILE